MVFHWSLSDNVFSQVFRTLLSILADLNKTVVWMASSRPLISMSSSLCTNSLVTVARDPIRIGITVTLMFHSIFTSVARTRYSSLFSISFDFTPWSARTAIPWLGTQGSLFFFFFFFFFFWPGRLAEIRWSDYISKSHKILCVSFSRMNSGLGIYHLLVWSNLNLLHNSQWITFPTQTCLVVYSFCAILLHSLIMSLVVSSLHHII